MAGFLPIVLRMTIDFLMGYFDSASFKRHIRIQCLFLLERGMSWSAP
jgi:hypothetical protein